jgi:hypothetical protein
VNPATRNSAVAGMPLSQAGVAAATTSTSRQVGAALGVAVSGTVVAASYARGMDFTKATHAIRWMMTACGAVVNAGVCGKHGLVAGKQGTGCAIARRTALISHRPIHEVRAHKVPEDDVPPSI